MNKLFYVGIGGFIGAALRYIISLQTSKWFNGPISIGTLFVNVLGGILIGLLLSLNVSPNLKLFLTTGLLGGLTTFSTFSYETIILFSSENYFFAVANICLNLFLSLGGVLLGKFLSHSSII